MVSYSSLLWYTEPRGQLSYPTSDFYGRQPTTTELSTPHLPAEADDGDLLGALLVQVGHGVLDPPVKIALNHGEAVVGQQIACRMVLYRTAGVCHKLNTQSRESLTFPIKAANVRTELRSILSKSELGVETYMVTKVVGE